eukprot:gene22184-28722_t
MNNNTNAVNAPIHPGPWQSLQQQQMREQQNSAEYGRESDTTTDDLSDDDISYDALRNEMFLEEYFRQQSLRMQAIYPPSFKSKINSKVNNKNSHTKGSRSINEGTTKSYAIEQPRNSSKYHRQRNSSLHGSDKVRSTTRKGELSDIILGSLEKLGIIRSDRRKSIS